MLFEYRFLSCVISVDIVAEQNFLKNSTTLQFMFVVESRNFLLKVANNITFNFLNVFIRWELDRKFLVSVCTQ